MAVIRLINRSSKVALAGAWRTTSRPRVNTRIPVAAKQASGRDRSRAICRVSLSGSHSSSSSQNATRSPEVPRIPVLRAPARPGRRSFTMPRTLRPAGAPEGSSCGVHWSKTTTQSTGPS